MQLTKLFRLALTAALLLAGAAQQARADIQTVTGDTTFAPTFLRPGYRGGEPPSYAPDVAYQAYNISVTVDDWQYSLVTACDFNCTAFFYKDSFDPKNPQKNIMDGAADDGFNLTGLEESMSPGHKYVLVIAGYYDYDWGAYSTTVGGPGEIHISPVPEPSAYLTLLAGLAGLGLLARRRRA